MIDGASAAYDAIIGSVVAGKLLDHGITTVRDAGSMVDGIDQCRRAEILMRILRSDGGSRR